MLPLYIVSLSLYMFTLYPDIILMRQETSIYKEYKISIIYTVLLFLL